MAHQRALIRNAVREQLLGRTAAASRVYKTREVPWARTELPGIAIYALSEPIDPESQDTAPRELTRNLRLVIEGAVEAKSDVDDRMDDLAAEIERAIDADPNFAGTAHDSILSNTEMGIAVDGNRPVGTVIMTYLVQYHTQAPAATDVKLDDFGKADVKTSLGGAVHPGNQSEDLIILPPP
jgi:hypothetical protein